MKGTDPPKKKLVLLDPYVESKTSRALRDFLQNKIKGQERALRYVADGYEIYHGRLRDPRRPIFVALMLGPSGVGKTYTAKALAEYFFGNPEGFTKILCTQFSFGHETAWLSGAPPGFIGHTDNPVALKLSQFNIDKYDLLHRLKIGEIGKMHAKYTNTRELEKLKRHKKEVEIRLEQLKKNKKGTPETKQKERDDLLHQLHLIEEYIYALKKEIKEEVEVLKNLDAMSSQELYEIYTSLKEDGHVFQSIILFDELEKASREMYNQLLEIMDEGRYEVAGHSVSFRNSFILMTGNIGSVEIAELLSDDARIGFHQEGERDADQLDDNIYEVTRNAARRYFPPEFLGRVDKVIVFRPLMRKELEFIFDGALADFMKHLMHDANLPLIIRFTKPAKKYVLDRVERFPEMGARAIERRLDRYLKVPLARMRNAGTIQPGDTLVVTVHEDKLQFHKDTSNGIVTP